MTIGDSLKEFFKAFEILINPPPLPDNWPEVSSIVSAAFDRFRQNMLDELNRALNAVEQCPQQDWSITAGAGAVTKDATPTTNNKSVEKTPQQKQESLTVELEKAEKLGYDKGYKQGFQDGFDKCLAELISVGRDSGKTKDRLELEISDELDSKPSKIPRLESEQSALLSEVVYSPSILHCSIALFGHIISYATHGTFRLNGNRLIFSNPSPTDGSVECLQRTKAKMERGTVTFEVEMGGTNVKILPREGVNWNDFKVSVIGEGQLEIAVPE